MVKAVAADPLDGGSIPSAFTRLVMRHHKQSGETRVVGDEKIQRRQVKSLQRKVFGSTTEGSSVAA